MHTGAIGTFRNIILAIVLLISSTWSFEISARDSIAIDSVFTHCPEKNYNRLVGKSPRTYISLSSRDINYDIATIVTFLMEPKNQTHLFHWFKKFELVEKKDSTWYYEIVYGPFGYWSIIDLKRSFYNDSTGEFVFYQNHDKGLNEVYGKKCRRLYVVENQEQIMQWKLLKLGKNKTRIGFIVQSIPNMYIPNWLYRLTINTVLPECLQDIEDTIGKKLKGAGAVPYKIRE